MLEPGPELTPFLLAERELQRVENLIGRGVSARMRGDLPSGLVDPWIMRRSSFRLQWKFPKSFGSSARPWVMYIVLGVQASMKNFTPASRSLGPMTSPGV